MPTKRSFFDFVGCRVEIGLTDKSRVTGRVLAYDRDSNLAISDAETVRTTKTGKELRRHLGLIYLRGAVITTIVLNKSLTSAPTVCDSRGRSGDLTSSRNGLLAAAPTVASTGLASKK